MRYLLGAAILSACFLIAAPAGAQTPLTTIEVQARDLLNPPPQVWSNPSAGRVAYRPRRYVRRAHPRAGFYDFPRHYPAQHELPPIFYGSRFGF